MGTSMPDLAFQPNPLGQLWLPDWGPASRGEGSTPLTGWATRGGLTAGAGELAIALTKDGQEVPARFDPKGPLDHMACHQIDPVFVYGTLMAGERLHEHMHRFGHPGHPLRAATAGRLVSYGAYPGLIPGGPERVQGELFRPRNTPQLLSVLDQVEGFAGYGASDSLFRRAPLEVEAGGATLVAWGYLSLRPGGVPIPSGSWRER